MSTIAIIGAGPGLGLATAHRFGREGFSVALISRTQENLDRLAAELATEGITARGYTPNVRDPHALQAALEAAVTDLGRGPLRSSRAVRIWARHRGPARPARHAGTVPHGDGFTRCFSGWCR